MILRVIRPATRDDVPLLPAIEIVGGELFRTVGMDAIAGDEAAPAPVLRAYVDDGRAWVALVDGEVVGYLLADVVDGCGHVDQVTVDPRHARRGIGAALLDRAAGWASARGLDALTLTTFRDVAWNGPYYERCGFRWLVDAEVTPGLAARRADEAAQGLDRWPRGCMRREISGARPVS